MGSLLVFDYVCETYSHEFEELVTAEEKDSVNCPECGSPAKRQVNASGLATYSFMTPHAKQEHLKERSRKHTKREIKNHGIDKAKYGKKLMGG